MPTNNAWTMHTLWLGRLSYCILPKSHIVNNARLQLICLRFKEMDFRT